MMQLPSPRDILLFQTEQGIMISAVDSCGGIGVLPHDSLCVDPFIVGLFTARVALLEIMAAGATPAIASLAVCNGPDAAAPIIAGVKKALGKLLPLIISTEKNIPTSMTGIGVTVTGYCDHDKCMVARSRPGDALYCVGIPLVGEETVKKNAQLFDAAHLEVLFQNKHVHSLIPVGSTGIAAEAAILAAESGLACCFDPAPGVNLYKSAGPSTCAVFTADGENDFSVSLPVTRIGTLVKAEG